MQRLLDTVDKSLNLPARLVLIGWKTEHLKCLEKRPYRRFGILNSTYVVYIMNLRRVYVCIVCIHVCLYAYL